MIPSNKEIDRIKVSNIEPTNGVEVWIKTKAKNLFNMDGLLFYNNSSKTFEPILDNPDNATSLRVRTTSFAIEGGKDYIMSGFLYNTELFRVRTFNSSKTELGEVEPVNNCFTLDSNVAYINLLFRKSDNSDIAITDITEAELQLEEGTVATEYEPYREKGIYILNDNNEYEKFM